MNDTVALLLHALAGWGLCGAVMAVCMARLPLGAALAVHGAAAPVIFTAVTWSYFRWFGAIAPLPAAAVLVATVIVLDAVVVAGLVQRSFAMFASIAGTWLPFALIFLASWAAGSLVAGG